MLKLVIKIPFSRIVSQLVIAVILGMVGYPLITPIDSVSASSSLIDLPLNTWTRVNLSDKTMCSDGSEYYMYARRATSENLVIHFAGGGIAWDAKSTSQPMDREGGFYVSKVYEFLFTNLEGISKHDNPNNPFADWNEVYLPYCTGDFHIGNATITYPLANGKSITIHHDGHENVIEALDWIYATFKQPSKLVVAGESAGGFASTFWVPLIAAHYSQADTYNLSDGAYLETSKWADIVDKVWQANAENVFGFTPADNLINSAYLRPVPPAAPHITYLQFNTLYDGALTYFASVLNDKPYDATFTEAWSQGLRASVKELAQSDLDYNYFLTDYGFDKVSNSTPHMSIPEELFYTLKQDDVFVRDWVRRIVIDGDHFSVGSEFLP